MADVDHVTVVVLDPAHCSVIEETDNVSAGPALVENTVILVNQDFMDTHNMAVKVSVHRPSARPFR